MARAPMGSASADGNEPPAGENGPLSGVVPGVATVALVLLTLRLAGVAPLPAFAVADVAGVTVAVLLSRRRAGPGANLGLAAVLTLAYSMLVGVLATFLLAIVGVR